MAANPYAAEPLQVTLYDPARGAPVRSYFFLGSVPEAVRSAAERGRPEGGGGAPPPSGRWPEARWAPADEKTLQRHYGPHWRELLTPCVRDAAPLWRGTAGGGVAGEGAAFGDGGADAAFGDGGLADAAFGDDDDDLADAFGDLADAAFGDGSPEEAWLPREDAPADAYAPPPPPPEAAERPPWDSATLFSGQAAYPEDSFADLKLKIFAATGVPPYRQHLFFGRVGGGVATTYAVEVAGAPLPLDVRQLAVEMAGGSKTAVAGLPVDPRLEELKEEVVVEALDGFRFLGGGARVRRVFVADLAALFAGRAAALELALGDRYQADLLYCGLALKYWPQLSPEAFRLAALDPRQLPEAFPLLAPPLPEVARRLALERAAVDAAYAAAPAAARAAKDGKVAVTEARLGLPPRGEGPLSLRAAFDWVAVSRAVPAAVARLPPGEGGLEGGAGGGRERDLLASKTHVSAAAPGLAAAIESFCARPPGRAGLAYAVLREGGVGGAPPRLVTLGLAPDGRAALRGSWREDARAGFDEVVGQLSAAVAPLYARINAMGAAAFPRGGRLVTPLEATQGLKGRAALGALAAEALTVSTSWPRALSAARFREFKALWREYEKAGLVGVRGLQPGGGFGLFFRKGVGTYRRVAAERAVAPARAEGPASGAPLNLYAHLTDPAAAARWAAAFPGRQVRVVHRTVDLKLEVVGATFPEFERIELYAFALCERFGGRPQPPAAARSQPPAKRLQALLERDPDLFDLKKHDVRATVYSVLCQGDRQPAALAEAEGRAAAKPAAAALSSKGAVAAYWNFTEGRPAFYRCPSAKFPYLSFRAEVHPRGYCLPCCKKAPPVSGTRASEVALACLAKKGRPSAGDLAAAGEGGAAARHVLSYGKAPLPGRIAEPPALLTGQLFYDALPPPYELALLGVEQQLPAVPDAGLFFALAAATGRSPPELARELAGAAREMDTTYYSLAEGRAAFFSSAADLAEALLSAFLPRPDAGFSPFAPGGGLADAWEALLADLCAIRYDLEVASFVDASGGGGLAFQARPRAAARLRASAHEGGDFVLVLAAPFGLFPLVALDRRAYLASPGAAEPRRYFSAAAPGAPAASTPPDGVVAILRAMAATAPEGGEAALAEVLGLARREGWAVEAHLVDLHDRRYGLLLAPVPGRPERVYWPLPRTPYHLPPPAAEPAAPALYGARPPGVYPAALLARALQARGASPHPSARLVAPGGSLVGFVGPSPARLFYHHDPVPAAGAPLPWGDPALPEAPAPYPMAEVDRAVVEAAGAPTPPLDPPQAALAARGAWRDNLYPLFVAEFAALLAAERDGPRRARLEALIRGAGPGPEGAAELLRLLGGELEDAPQDARALRAVAVAAWAREGPGGVPAALSAELAARRFGFDAATLARLRALGRRDRGEAARELEALMAPRVTPAPPPAAPPQNLYAACSLATSLDRPQCVGEKLGLPAAEDLAAFSGVLLGDLLNPGKEAALAVASSGFLAAGAFIQRPGERLVLRPAP